MKSEYENEVDTPLESEHLGWSGSVKAIHPRYVFDGTLNYSYDKDSTLLPKTPKSLFMYHTQTIQILFEYRLSKSVSIRLTINILTCPTYIILSQVTASWQNSHQATTVFIHNTAIVAHVRFSKKLSYENLLLCTVGQVFITPN